MGERDKFLQLTTLLETVQVHNGVVDSWVWRVSPSTNSAYSQRTNGGLKALHITLAEVWRINIPRKVVFLTWRTLRDRLPTKDNSWKRGIITDEAELMCPLCNQQVETMHS